MPHLLVGQPEIDLVLVDSEKQKYEVRPKNETAKRIIQMMNLQIPQLRR